MEKKIQKNKTMRVAAVLAVVTALSLCMLAGTFAKYTTTNGGSDTARVAKWGIELASTGSLYGASYDSNYKPQSWTDASTGKIASNSSATDKLLAPGAKSDAGIQFTFKGTPEVATNLNATITTQNVYLAAGTYAHMVEAKGVTAEIWGVVNGTSQLYTLSGTTYSKSTGWAASTTYYKIEDTATLTSTYYPVKYNGFSVTGNNTADSIKEIGAAFAKELNGGTAVTATDKKIMTVYTISKSYDANTNFGSIFTNLNDADKNKISWAWTFDGADYDPADTILGLLEDSATAGSVVKLSSDTYVAVAAGTETELKDYNLNTSFEVNIQLDQA